MGKNQIRFQKVVAAQHFFNPVASLWEFELNIIIPDGVDIHFEKDFYYIAHNLLVEFDLSALGI